MYPKHIEGTWQFNGDWFGSMRLVASDQDLETYPSIFDSMLCPICEYPAGIYLGHKNKDFPLSRYCPECGSIWRWYVARCPDCDGLMRKKDCKEGELKCSQCGMVWDIASIKEINSDPEFHSDEE